ncbi:menaquinone biosynthesis protein [Telmatocola sphagniphila]|uniref:Chorismate dehydratase n=1 Tax=Telmatocola sphagniphila TaxID=1123043 RepID=A0A8E6ET65_9BACT|nr:menaquinone biosynthesis protein [Telmatocola sphagniphila]QVL32029.1 menaquinone biosynthesis protein [Telmatocola sphagniphila]
MIRVGSVNYLNAKPLIEGFAALAPQAELVLDLPSRIADQLHRKELDVALVPVVEFFRGTRYKIIPDISIASHGPVLSVTLFSRKPWDQINSVALDIGSRSSAALTQILLRKRYYRQITLEPLSMTSDPENSTADAVLLIGDRAMRACLPGFDFAYDLGEEWTRWQELPFVYAVWAVREGVDLEGVDEALRQAKELGRTRAGWIAQREAEDLGLDPGYCRRYLTNIIHYDLGKQELAGLQQYYQLATELGLAPEGVQIEYYHPKNSVESRRR